VGSIPAGNDHLSKNQAKDRRICLQLSATAATAFFVVQPVKASHVVQGGPTYVTVPDAGSTISLLGFALLGVAALRRKLSR
jgi:hypothetical protein